MVPVRTRASNFVYRGPTPDVGDAWVERRPEQGVVILTWKPTDEERAAIAAGALVDVGIYGIEPIPPTSVNVSPMREISAIGAALRDRARRVLIEHHGVSSPARIPPGYWLVSGDVLEDLEASEALDPTAGVPLLFERPLMVSSFALAAKGQLEFIAPAKTNGEVPRAEVIHPATDGSVEA